MRIIVLSGLAAIAAGLGAAAQAQQQSSQQAAEAALSNGYLADQNARLTAQGGGASDTPFATRANVAIGRGDFTGALAILRPYRLEQPETYRYLSGIAYAGLGDVANARKMLTAAMKSRRNYTEAQVALGEMEARIGDRAAAAAILAQVKDRQSACGTCGDAAGLARGIARIEAALAVTRP